jgi:hypothetical protein
LFKLSDQFEIEDIICKEHGENKAGCPTLMQAYEFKHKQMLKLVGFDYKISTEAICSDETGCKEFS